MKKLNLANCAALLAGAVVLVCASANAQTYISLNLQTGVATSSSPIKGPSDPTGAFLSTSGSPTSLTEFGASGADPLFNAYAFSTETSPLDLASLVPENGEVFIYDSSSHIPANLINVIGFLVDNPSYMVDVSLVPGTPGYLSGGLPSDFTTFVGNAGDAVSLTEGLNGITTWTPTGQPQPGFLDDGGTPVTYTFINNVPDGGTTLCLLGSSMVVLGALRRRLMRD